MKVTIESCGREVSIFSQAETMDEVVHDLLIPALLAAGFHPNTVGKYLDEEYGAKDEGELFRKSQGLFSDKESQSL